MAKIQLVDYAAIPSQAKAMRNLGKSLNKEMTNYHDNISNLQKYWYGKRYNSLVKIFNEMIPSINDMLKLVVTDIPTMLETVANNYSQADQGKNVTTICNDAPKKLQNIAKSNESGMKFISSNVEQIHKKVITNFVNARSYMNDIGSAYKKIKWSSEASKAFESKFNKLKNNINSSFNDIKKQFDVLMKQAEQDVQKAENANTVS